MALIKDRKPAADRWKLLEADPAGNPPGAAPTDDLIVPLSVWRAHRETLLAREGRIGVWLAAGEDPADIAQDLGHFHVVAVHFKSANDGRGYSTGTLLRQRYGWQGELRAVGDIGRDMLFYLARCGFDAYALREGEDVDAALTAFRDFTESYQGAVDQPAPLFRRREGVSLRDPGGL